MRHPHNAQAKPTKKTPQETGQVLAEGPHVYFGLEGTLLYIVCIICLVEAICYSRHPKSYCLHFILPEPKETFEGKYFSARFMDLDCIMVLVVCVTNSFPPSGKGCGVPSSREVFVMRTKECQTDAVTAIM